MKYRYLVTTASGETEIMTLEKGTKTQNAELLNILLNGGTITSWRMMM